MSLTTPVLYTTRLRLRPFTEADTDAIYALMSNATVLRYWDAPPWTERARADRLIARCQEAAQEGSGVRLAIERADDGLFIGWCAFMPDTPGEWHLGRVGLRPHAAGSERSLFALSGRTAGCAAQRLVVIRQ